VTFSNYFSNISGNISVQRKDKSIRLPLYESSLNSGSNKGSLVKSGSAGASNY
jgi:hypothetical protein